MQHSVSWQGHCRSCRELPPPRRRCCKRQSPSAPSGRKVCYVSDFVCPSFLVITPKKNESSIKNEQKKKKCSHLVPTLYTMICAKIPIVQKGFSHNMTLVVQKNKRGKLTVFDKCFVHCRYNETLSKKKKKKMWFYQTPFDHQRGL